MSLPPEIVQLNQILEDAARRDLARTRQPWRRLRSAIVGQRRHRRSAVLALGLLFVAGGAAYGVAKVIDSPPRHIVREAELLGAKRPVPSDAIHLGGHTVWALRGVPSHPLTLVSDRRTTPDMTIGCSTFTRSTVIALCGGVQEPGRPAIYVGRTSATVVSVEAIFAAGRVGHTAIGHGVWLVEGPPASGPRRLGPRPIRLVARDGAGHVVGEVRVF